jgi:hypothetical protein
MQIDNIQNYPCYYVIAWISILNSIRTYILPST